MYHNYDVRKREKWAGGLPETGRSVILLINKKAGKMDRRAAVCGRPCRWP